MGKMKEWLSQIKWFVFWKKRKILHLSMPYMTEIPKPVNQKLMIQKNDPGRMSKGDIEIREGRTEMEIILEHRRKNLEKIQEAHKD